MEVPNVRKQSGLDNHCGRRVNKPVTFQSYKRSLREKLKTIDYIGFIPIARVIYKYKVKEYLVRDILSGIGVGMSMIPQAMGYATILGVPVVYGLYSIIFSSLIYSIFTTSIHASCTIAISSVIFTRDVLEGLNLPLINATDDGNIVSPEMNVRLNAIYVITFIAGVTCIVISLTRLSSLVRFCSDAYIEAIFFSVGLSVIVNQFPNLLDVKPQTYSGAFNMIKFFIETWKEISNTNLATLSVSIVSVAILLFFKQYINIKYNKNLPAPIPIDVIVMLLGTLLSSLLDWKDKYDMAVIGAIPSKIPTPEFPLKSDWTDYIVSGVTVGFLSYLNAPVLFRHFANIHNYKVSIEQEGFALGLSTLLGACLSNVALGMSGSRIFIMESGGGKTQLAYVFAALTSLGVVMALADYASKLPSCIIAAILVVTFLPSFKAKRLRKYFVQDKLLFCIWIITVGSAVVFTLTKALLYGFIASVFIAAMRTLYPEINILEKIEYERRTYYVKAGKYMDSHIVSNSIKVIKISGTLYYASTEGIIDQILEIVDQDNTTRTLGKSTEETKVDTKAEDKHIKISDVILDLASVPYIDLSAMRMLMGLQSKLSCLHEISLHLASCTESTRKTLTNAPNVMEKLNDQIYATVEDAVDYCHKNNKSLDASIISNSSIIIDVDESRETINTFI